MRASGTGYSWGYATGGVVFKKIESLGEEINRGTVVFEKLIVQGVAADVALGAVVMQPLVIWNQSAAVRFEKLIVFGTGDAVLPEVYSTQVMNSRTYGVTEYTKHEFNSYAKIGSKYYGAGPAGLVRLGDGGTDDGDDIEWVLKTGQMDDKDIGLKRLPEVLLGLRNTGDVLVRVWQDDNTFNDYILPASVVNSIHQQRVKCGKGMRSRYYAVELRGIMGKAIELDSMQVNMTKTTRRLG